MNTRRTLCKLGLPTGALLFMLLLLLLPASAQGPLPFSEAFASFTGAGFAPNPAAGQLDSDDWIVTGLSDGDLGFGDTGDSGDYARGQSSGGVTTGGVYAFDVGGGNPVLGVQPGGSDFTPGEFILRLQNNTGSAVHALDVSYTIWYYNDQARANSLTLTYSLDNMVYTDVPTLDFTTPEAADLVSVWTVVPRTTQIGGLNLADGGFFYLKWTGNDVSGTGSRDEYGIDDVQVTPAIQSGFAIDKHAPPSVDPAQVFTYTLVVENATGITPTTTTITDVVPTGADFIDASDGGSHSGGVVTWNVASLADGAIVTRTLRVTATTTGGFAIVNDAYGVHGGGDWPTTTLGAPITTIVNAPSLLVEKSGPASVGTGELFSYMLIVDNQTPATLTDLLISDTLPLSLTYQSSTPPGNWDLASHTITWSAASLAADEVLTCTIDVVAPDVATVLTNSQYVVWANEWPTPTSGAPVETLVSGCNNIYNIQYTTEPGDGTYPSLCLGQNVTVEGVVYAVFPDYYDGAYFIQEPGGGVWRGVMVFDGTNSPATGDLVQLTAEVYEHYGLTELVNVSGYTLLSAGHSVAVDVITADQILFDNSAVSEGYEDVFVEVHDISVTVGNDDYNIWTFTDASTGVGKADDWGYDADPNVGDTIAILRGALVYSHDEYKVVPRDAGDVIGQIPYGLFLTKSAPSAVSSGAELTYTLEVQNWTGITLTQLVVTDVVPANTVFVRGLDGGVLTGGTVSWTLPSLADANNAYLRFVVQASGSNGDVIYNDDYVVWAANWLTPTLGEPVLTVIGDYTPIYVIQGDGFLSSFEGQSLKTVGAIVGFFEGNYPGGGDFDGFYLQDPTGDDLDDTSDGIFVQYGIAGLGIGDAVTVTGVVQEFSEYDQEDCYGNECQTQILASAVQANGTGNVAPVTVDPPGDPDQAALYWEALEGMLVTFPSTATVVGPTSYGTVMAVRGDLGIERVIRTGPYAGMPVGVRHHERYGDIGGSDPPDLIVGSAIDNADGPLGFSYGSYLVVTQQDDAWVVDYDNPPPTQPVPWPPAVPDQFSAATFNAYNFDVDSGVKMDKVVASIVELGCPTFLALEEISVADSMTALLANLNTQNCAYSHFDSHPDVGNRGVALLWRSDQVSDVTPSDGYQSCSADGSSSSTYDPLWDYCQSMGQYPLFSRRPVVVTGTVSLGGQDVQIVTIANHFKSKLGGASADQRRLEQGQFVGALVDWLVDGGSTNVLVLGDLNDFEDAPPLEALYASGNLANGWDWLPEDARYSYIYRGVSQVLDHILVSPLLWTRLVDFGPLHYNADYPYGYSQDGSVVWRTSDHDLLAATFSTVTLPWLGDSTKTVEPAGSVMVGDHLTYTVTLLNTGITATVNVTDTLPDDLTLVSGFDGGAALTWTGTIATDESVQISLTVQANPALTETSVVSNNLTINDGANQPFDIHSPETSILVETPSPDLSTSIKAVEPSGDVVAGEHLTYTVTLDNSGETATVSVTDTLPAELVLVSGFDGGAALTWTGVVTGSEQVLLTLVAQVDPHLSLTTTVSNNLSINDGVNQPFYIHSPENRLLPSSPPTEPDLSASTKAVEPSGDVMVGDHLTYTVTLLNTGITATVNVSDTLPDDLILVSGFDGGVALNWTGTIAPDESVQISLTVQANPALTETSVVSNNLTINDGVNQPFDIHSPETTILVETPTPDLSTSTKAVEPSGDVMAGERLTYTITLRNSGTTATVSVTDTLPAELILVSGFDGGAALIWTGVVTGGEQVLLTLVAQVDPALSLTTTVSNTLAINDGLHDVFSIVSPESTLLPDWQHYVIYLPVVLKNH